MTLITAAAAALGAGPLTPDAVRSHVFPLFSRVLQRREIYLANHSLGRPLDRTAEDVAAGLAAWYTELDGAWGPWFDEIQRFRCDWAQLLNAPRPDCIVPKSNAGQGLRAILNTWDQPPRVVATRGEFDSLDFILKQYAARGRASVRWIEPAENGRYTAEVLLDALRQPADLVILSPVLFGTGEVLPRLPELVATAQAAGAKVLLDVYHMAGAIPVDLTALNADFAVGGSYKYLRGGPGACWLYLHPRQLDGSLTTLDTGWFAKREPFSYQRPDIPEFGEGGDAFMESTPAVLPFYQSRAGREFVLAVGVDRLRAYSLMQLQALRAALAECDVAAQGGDAEHGAFLVVDHPDAPDLARRLLARGVNTDARGRSLRLCPDLLTTTDELTEAAAAVAAEIRS